MKTLKAICTAGLLALALSVPAYAGDVYTPGSPAPADVSTPGEREPTQEFPGFADLLLALIASF